MYKKRISFMLYLLSISLISGCMEQNKEITTKSGLRYIVLQEPKAGAQSPKAGSMVEVHYSGWLDREKTKKFDSSKDRNQPFRFTVGVGQVIKGWDEAVLGMKVGEKRFLIIPADLGYGSRGFPGAIPGNATLYFEVELLKA